MTLSLVTAPALEPVTLAQQKLHSRIVSDAEDSLIEGFIRAARIHAETVQRRQLITAMWRLSLDQFPCGPIYLPLPPLQSVTSVTYVDAAGQTQTLADCQVDTYREPGRIVPAYGSLWPTARCQPNSVNVIFVAGYGDLSSDVPESTRQAIKLLAGHYFENREAVVVGTITSVLPMAVDALLSDGKFGGYA